MIIAAGGGPEWRVCAKLAAPGGPGWPKGTDMHRRAILLLILLVVLAVFYASVAVDRAPVIISSQKAQTEQLNRLDEQVLSAPDGASGEDED